MHPRAKSTKNLPAPEATPEATTTVEPPPPPEFRIGDIIPIRTGVILDHNGNPVPDGTPVSFIFTLSGELSEIYDACMDEGIQFVDMRHEQGVANAATGYAMATGEPGLYEPKFYVDFQGQGSMSSYIPLQIDNTELQVSVANIPDYFAWGIK
jgi:hypothetical protein